MADKAQLEALKRFDHVWHELHSLLSKCASTRRVTEGDEEQHANLLRECRALYGRLSPIIGTAGIESFGRQFDAFQHILGQPSLSAIFGEEAQGLWLQLWASGASGIGQAIGRLEEKVRQSQAAPSPEIVARWRWAIAVLERTRIAVSWVASRPRFLTPVVQRLEGSPVYRIVAMLSTFGGLIATILTVGAALGLISVVR